MLKRAVSLFFALALLVSLAPAPTDAAASVCFTAVNDQLLPLSDETMPFWSGGTFYVPSSAIDGNDLGIHYNRNLEHTAIVLYKVRNAITFNYSTGTVETNSGQHYVGTVIIRGSIVFLPLDVLCRFFGLEYTYTRINYGYLLRIKSDSVVLSDATFIDAAESSFAQRYAQYERAQAPVVPAVEEPDNTAVPQVEAKRTFYPVIGVTDAASAGQVLSQLSGGRATYLFTPQSLIGADDLLRRLCAGDGAVALRIDASAGVETALVQIDEANELLWRAACVKTRLVRLDNAGDDTIRAVSAAGYCPLRYALDFSAGGVSVSRMVTRITRAADGNGGSCCVFLGADEHVVGTLSTLLSSLRAGNCTPARLNEVILS
ncbi:MAG: hypothetical protein IKN81_08430 [Oscillospiraceae bacterium]|nr:hypothetical protein [Oscillospiraceae bacterium]